MEEFEANSRMRYTHKKKLKKNHRYWSSSIFLHSSYKTTPELLIIMCYQLGATVAHEIFPVLFCLHVSHFICYIAECHLQRQLTAVWT